MHLPKLASLLSLGLFAVTGCAMTPEASEDDADIEDVEVTADELQSGAYTYYTARPDYRRCVSPLCGGFWIARVNRATTRCADGKYANECYVTELDLSRLGLGDAGDALLREAVGNSRETTRAVFRGVTRRTTHPQFGTLGKFRATEGWTAPEAGTITGDFFKVTESGIRCVRAPCPDQKAIQLNSSKNQLISRFDLSAAPGSPMDHSEAQSAAYRDGVLAAGTIQDGAVGGGRSLAASQFFLRAVKSAGNAGDRCSTASQCGAGLSCCYPCGIQGCHNVCMATSSGPGPVAGGCPMFP